MKPVYQTRFGNSLDQPGNCFAAAIASVFETPLDEVPDEAELIARLADNPKWMAKNERERRGDAWAKHWIEISEWLYACFQVRMLEIQARTKNAGGLVRDDDVICLLCGPSPRGLPHCVVGRGVKIIHDPHPEGGGVDLDAEDATVIYFVAVDPGGKD